MLSYVFWHWHRPDVEPGTYERNLCRFHEVLFQNRSPGFRYSRVVRTEQAPWIGRSERTYEDWSMVDDSAALDPLNERAVSGACEEPHREISRLTLGSAAALYRLTFGLASLALAGFLYRFDKPRGQNYRSFFDSLESVLAGADAALWTRQMNLGPGPEFCLQSTSRVDLPSRLTAAELPVAQICCTLPLQQESAPAGPTNSAG